MPGRPSSNVAGLTTARSSVAGSGRPVPEQLRELALRATKRSLVRLGYRLPGRAHYHVSAGFDYLRLGAWLAKRGLRPGHFRDRNALFAAVAEPFAHERVLYLEFGVSGGGSMREWSKLLRNPQSELHGFDSFEGLPSDWIAGRPAGHFDRGGQPPQVDDPRVRFHKGWFSETLPRFEWPDGRDRLVANFDADLYSSTAEALAFVEPHVRAGTILYFDELNHHEHELRAFDEFLARTGLGVRALGEADAMSNVAFEVI